MSQVEYLKHVLRQLPPELQEGHFDEDDERALRAAQWLIQNHAVVLPNSISVQEWGTWFNSVRAPHERAQDHEDIQTSGHLILGALTNLARGE